MGQHLGRCGPRRLDPHHKSKITEQTLRRYQLAAKRFCSWLDEHSFSPRTADEWDDLLVEFKADQQPTRSHFTELTSSVAFFFPSFRGQLPWSQAVLDGWTASADIKHVTPMPWGFAVLFASRLALLGYPRLAAGLLVQQRTGMRPSEMLNLCGDDVVIPIGNSPRPVTMIRLGHRTRGTKAKREQYSLLFHDSDLDIVSLLHDVKAATDDEQRLFPFSISTYRRLLLKVEVSLGGGLGFTPHSPRAGFASDSIAAGKPWSDIKESGRWISDTSFRIYLDLVGAAALALLAEKRGLLNEQAATAASIKSYFPAGCFGDAVGIPCPGIPRALQRSNRGEPTRREPSPHTIRRRGRGGRGHIQR